MNIITHLQKRIESILDHDLETPSEEVLLAKKNFEVLTDPRLLRGLAESLPNDNTDKAVILFSRLALYFDAGVFLEADKTQWEPQAQFHRGHVSVLKPAQKKKISLPKSDLMSVLRTDAKPLLQKMDLKNLDAEGRTVCLFIRPGTDFAFLLFSSLPDLWLKDHIRAVTEAIHRGINNE
ncbi:MAG: GTP cyclohydrolase [Bdellovibrionales bacterium]|nr:GTP cyclohydrolase [Bdellovibrionales bacterium]